MFKLKKSEILSEYGLIRRLLFKGKDINTFEHIKIKYLLVEYSGIEGSKILIHVSKKLLAKAVDRNKIRRRIKEAWRLSKNRLNLKTNQIMLVKLIYKNCYIVGYENIYDSVNKIITKLNRILS